MNKTEFVNQLSAGLMGLSQEDIKRSMDFYTEMIDDRIEDGMPEEEAVAALGSIEEIRGKILEEIPITRIVKEKITPKRSFKAWEIILLILGSPVWLPLLLSFIVVCLIIYFAYAFLICTHHEIFFFQFYKFSPLTICNSKSISSNIFSTRVLCFSRDLQFSLLDVTHIHINLVCLFRASE